MMKSVIILTLALSSAAHAQSILDTLRDRVNDNLNQDQQSTTITYEHRTERSGECEKNAIRIAEDQAKAACREEYKKSCELVDRVSIVQSEQEMRVTMSPIEKIAGYETDKERECEEKALKKARDTAKNACILAYGMEAHCEVDDGRIRTPVRKAFRVPGAPGKQYKYECGASAIAFPRQNGAGSMFVCKASATAQVKKGGLRDIIRF